MRHHDHALSGQSRISHIWWAECLWPSVASVSRYEHSARPSAHRCHRTCVEHTICRPQRPCAPCATMRAPKQLRLLCTFGVVVQACSLHGKTDAACTRHAQRILNVRLQQYAQRVCASRDIRRCLFACLHSSAGVCNMCGFDAIFNRII